MPTNNKLIVPGCEEMLSQHREEIGEEFGIYHPAASRDLISSRLTREINENEKEKKEKSNDEHAGD